MIPAANNRGHAGLDPDGFRGELYELYAGLDDEVRSRRPVCDLSGRCCRFAEHGHTLFVSAPEAALLMADAPPPARPLDDGATCPWQDARGRCTARDSRPLGCRTYFCDPSFQDVMPSLAEQFVARLKELVDRLGLPWDYAPLHRHLWEAQQMGRLLRASQEHGRQIEVNDGD
jgi:hypothetical protein